MVRLPCVSRLLLLAGLPLAGAGQEVGTADFSLAVGETTGAMTVRLSDGLCLADDPAIAPVGLGVDGGEVSNLQFRAWTKVDDETLAVDYRAGDWSVHRFLQVRPTARMVRQWCDVTWCGAGTAKLRFVRLEGGVLPMAERGAFSFPSFVPPLRVEKSGFQVGRRRSWWWSPYGVAAADGAGRCAYWAVDESRPYSDRAHSWTEERADGLRVWTVLDAAGLMKSGVTQRVGDWWTAFGTGDLETARSLAWTWFKTVGQRPPADCPDWIKGNVLYCLHPRGPIQSDYRGWGGFSRAVDRLPDIAALGCNAIWLLPVEDEWPYTPRDYYKLMPGIGTPAEYKAFSRRAHALGFRLWQDLVAHGGRAADPRGRAHPDWLCRDEQGKAPDYWCFDFNNRGWIGYMSDVADWQAREYGLDGYRLDVISGSRIPNWDPSIAYARASHSQSQGGLNMGRALRSAVRRVNPTAANLAEAGENIQGTVNDALYDFPLCYEVIPRILHSRPDDFARTLGRWLDEKQRAYLPDLVLMRFIECHDSVRADWKYGPAVQTALMATTAWIDGFPLVLQGMEDRHYETYRRIFRIRRAVPELNGTEADYRSVAAPAGVFACLRGGVGGSVVLVNFDEVPVSGCVRLPEAVSGTAHDLWTDKPVVVQEGAFNVSLAPFGFTVVRMKPTELPPLPAPAAAEACPLPAAQPGMLDFSLSDGRIPLRAELRRADGTLVPGGYHVRREDSSDGTVCLTAVADGGLSLKGTSLTLRVPGAERWFAAGAEGWNEGVFRVALDGFDGAVGPFYRKVQASPTFHDTLLHPLPLEGACAGACLADGQAVVAEVGNCARVTLSSRFGSDHGLGVNVFPRDGQAPFLQLRLLPTTTLRTMSATLSSGDPRLKVSAGGWRWDNGRIRLKILRNGALGAFERKVGGGWRRVFAGATVYTDKGFGGKKDYYGQELELESEIGLERTAAGGVRLSFAGVLRRNNRMGKMKIPVRYWCSYELDDSDRVKWTLRLSADAVPYEWGYLALRIDHPEGCESHCSAMDYLHDLSFPGRKPRIYRSGSSWHVAWIEGGQTELVPGVPFEMATVLQCDGTSHKEWTGFSRGMGMGGWLTNYKRFNVLPESWRMPITVGDYEHFDSFITEADVARVKGWGFDHIRLGFDQIVLEESPFKYRERTFRKVDEFVGWCEKHGLNVVLNLHKAVGNYCDIKEKAELLDDAELQSRFVALWLEIERRYHDRTGLAFELLNEVRDVDPKKWNDLADRTLRAIRAKNPSRWVVIGSVCWNSASRLKDLRLWDDARVVYAFHMYEPFDFTHQRGVLQAGPLYYNRVMPYPTTDVERYREAVRLRDPKSDGGYGELAEIGRQHLRNCMRGAYQFVKAHPDKILWNGEFGTIRHAPKDARTAYMRDVVAICKEWGVPYCVWNYLSTPNDGNRFSLVDDETREFLSADLLKACLGE